MPRQVIKIQYVYSACNQENVYVLRNFVALKSEVAIGFEALAPLSEAQSTRGMAPPSSGFSICCRHNEAHGNKEGNYVGIILPVPLMCISSGPWQFNPN